MAAQSGNFCLVSAARATCCDLSLRRLPPPPPTHSLQGQGLIAPTPARVIFASSPLFSAVISYYLLPGELVGKMTWVGGSMIAAAGLAAALIPSRASPAAGATAKLKPA